jgi:indolepyruvate ferredoxin oxidoreductase beta subunit
MSGAAPTVGTGTLSPDCAAAAANPARDPTNVLIVGVGGQGVIMVSKVLALLAQTRGLEVKQSEVHGMAKRGGAVFSHVRFGQRVWSPTIPKGEVDNLVALEWAEGLRWLPYLKPTTGILICDTKRIVPPFACLNRHPGAALRYSSETPAEVVAHVAEGYAIDATHMAEELGNERAANVILLGALSAALDFSVADWELAVANFVPKKTVTVNLEAFRRGRLWIEEASNAASLTKTPWAGIPMPAGETSQVRLEINGAWCKSCDICVKFCPERCLRLNAEQIAELAAPDKCTGCRLCEWLCPDFAIRVHLDDAMTIAEGETSR